MRFRTGAVAAALVLCAATGLAACSSSSDTADATRPAGGPAVPTTAGPADDLTGHIETGKRQAGPPEMDGQHATGSAQCATSAAEIPAECALDLSFSGITEGERAAEPPVR
ncbi:MULTISPECIES: hypothetical protein [unclassified Streptomyces]|uniref:hypothetical protein n=1 Tax=unclassified Streptomyces TaxID=2593676 RepID=UPI0037926418